VKEAKLVPSTESQYLMKEHDEGAQWSFYKAKKWIWYNAHRDVEYEGIIPKGKSWLIVWIMHHSYYLA